MVLTDKIKNQDKNQPIIPTSNSKIVDGVILDRILTIFDKQNLNDISFIIIKYYLHQLIIQWSNSKMVD